MAKVLQLGRFPASPDLKDKLHSAVGDIPIHESVEDFMATGQTFGEVTGLLCHIRHKITPAVLDRLPALKVIASYGAGTDHLDLPEATRRGIVVTNTPGCLHKTTADLTFALILAVCRRVVESDKSVRNAPFPGWDPFYQLGIDVHGKTLGIVGLGEIGTEVAKRAQGFDMRVLYTKRSPVSPKIEKSLGLTYVPFETLIAESDIVTIHAPLTPETRHLFNHDVLSRMKPRSVLINTARGPIVDEAALVEALKNGPLYGAGLDVFEEEPKIHPELLKLENAVLAAHIGSATEASRTRMGDLALENLLAVLGGHAPLTPCNQLPVQV